MKYRIMRRNSNRVLFECEVPDTVPSEFFARYALEQAVEYRVDLCLAEFASANLQYGNFAGANLSDVNFSAALLIGANFTGANLDRANFCQAALIGADFTGANLGKSGFARSCLLNANFAQANLGGSIFSGAYSNYANFEGAKIGDGIELIGERPVFSFPPINPSDYPLTIFVTNCGIYVATERDGHRTIEEFRTVLLEDCDRTKKNRKDYEAALAAIEAIASIGVSEVIST